MDPHERELLRIAASKELPLSRPESDTRSEHGPGTTEPRPVAASDGEIAVEQLVQMGKSRGGYAAQVTIRSKRFNEAYDQGLHTCLLQQPLDDLEVAFDKFKDIHGRYMPLIAGKNPTRADECREHFDFMHSLVQNARYKFDQRMRQEDLEDKVTKQCEDDNFEVRFYVANGKLKVGQKWRQALRVEGRKHVPFVDTIKITDVKLHGLKIDSDKVVLIDNDAFDALAILKDERDSAE